MIVVAGLIGGASIFAWDRIASRDQIEALASAIDARNQALTTAARLADGIEGLQQGLARAETHARSLEDRLAATQAELLAMLGPPLDDGRYFGALITLGATQKPPRLVIDIQQWFTDKEAIAAAIEDGVIEPGEIIPNGYYIRNENPRWRTIEIDPAAMVSLTVYPYGQIDDPEVVSLARFADLAIDWSEYWITTEDGKVVTIEQQYIP